MPPQSAPRADSYGPLAWAIHDLSVAIAEADVSMSVRLGVSAGDYLAIKHVMSRPAQLGPVELGRVLGMSSGSATTLVDRLESAGHLLRQPHPTDRRRRVLTISGPTRETIDAALLPLGDAVEELSATYNDQQRVAIEQFLQAVTRLHRPGADSPASLGR